MFTGIVTDLGRVRAIRRDAGADARFEIETAYDTSDIELGASIACSGPCLTVVEKGPDWFAVEASSETLGRTTMGAWRKGTPVNLERAARLGQELGGHIVTGHIDAVIAVKACEPAEGSARFVFALPRSLAGFVAEKGSVALDGVSLTVNGVTDDAGAGEGALFDVNIIRHTRDVTTFGRLKAGDEVNVEVDILARYVARMSHAKGDRQ